MTMTNNSSNSNKFSELDFFNNGTISYDPVIEILAEFIWWYVVVAAVVGTFLNVFGLIYLLTKRRSGTVVTCMSCVVVADCVFLASMLGGLLAARLFPELPGSVICKLMTFNTNVTSLFSNWCWVLLWGGHYLAVFHPWRYYRMKYYSKLNCMLPTLLVGCVVWECWTLIFTTEVHSNCDLDTKIATYFTFKYLLLFEACLSYFVPLMLVMIADVRVFLWKYPMELMGPSELCTGDVRRPIKMEQVAIVSLKFKKTMIDGNRKIMRRFVLLASVDLLLNFPQVIQHLITAFRRGLLPYGGQDDSALGGFSEGTATGYNEPGRLEYVISAAGYSFYYLQYLLNAVHIAMLIPVEEKQRQQHSHHHGFDPSNCSGACSPNIRMLANSFSRNSTSKNEVVEKAQQQQHHHHQQQQQFQQQQRYPKMKQHFLLSSRPRASSSPLVLHDKERVDFV